MANHCHKGEPETPFLKWWRELNAILLVQGGYEVVYGDARYWFGLTPDPIEAAALVAEELAYEAWQNASES